MITSDVRDAVMSNALSLGHEERLERDFDAWLARVLDRAEAKGYERAMLDHECDD